MFVCFKFVSSVINLMYLTQLQFYFILLIVRGGLARIQIIIKSIENRFQVINICPGTHQPLRVQCFKTFFFIAYEEAKKLEYIY